MGRSRRTGPSVVNAASRAAYSMAGTSPALVAGRESDAAAASAVKALQAAGEHADARERYAELVSRHQRRASRIAYDYARDGAEADGALPDGFVEAYQDLEALRGDGPV